MLIEHKLKLAAKGRVVLAKVILESLKITEPAKTVTTTTITVSKETTSVGAAETADGVAVILTEGTMKPTQSAWATTIFGQSTLHKETNMTKRAKAANDLLSEAVIYTYWKDYGQFGDTKPRTIGHYANSVYTGAKKVLSYDTAHVMDQRMNAIMLNGVNEFSTILEKYEGFSIRHPKATPAFIYELLIVPR